MARALFVYDKRLPEIADRRPWEKPTSHLIKTNEAPEWRREDGRRPSERLLVPKIREAVDQWRDGGYSSASEVTQRLFRHWFEEDHSVAGYDQPFRFHFGQREAIETLAWLVECASVRDTETLISQYGSVEDVDLFQGHGRFQTTMEGVRQWIGPSGPQDLPAPDLRRYAFKMATGAGKTWVMAMAVVWAWFHSRRVPHSTMSRNFLIVAPNVIVYQRLEKDFANAQIFGELPLIPPEWMSDFTPRIILRGEETEPISSGNIFLTNIQQLHERDEWTPANPVEKWLGPKPRPSLLGGRPMWDRMKSLSDLIVMNDEAHHVHDEELAWNRSLGRLHSALPNGLSAWLDFSATPKDQKGSYFPWTVCDYPLAQAVEDRIIKVPLLADARPEDDGDRNDPDGFTHENVVEKCADWLQAAITRLREHERVCRELNVRPVLFIMADRNRHAKAIGAHLHESDQFDLKKEEVLVIHTKGDGKVTEGRLEDARQAARDIDSATNRIRVIVSVMMLREGWDVRNVTVVLGLRAFSAKSKILPEQVIGRGLRLMRNVSPDQTQTLEVFGTRNLLEVLREQLEADGVGIGTASAADLPAELVIRPVAERMTYDIAVPVTKPSLTRNVRRLDELRPLELDAIGGDVDLSRAHRIAVSVREQVTDATVHAETVFQRAVPVPEESVAVIVRRVAERCGLPTAFSVLYPRVKQYVEQKCFDGPVSVDDETVRSHLAREDLRERIAAYLVEVVGALTAEQKPIAFEEERYRLSSTRPFRWRRNLPPPCEATKTVFNYVATWNDFERRFAGFLDRAKDIARFSALGTTEQGTSGTTFRIDYLKPSGAIGFYYPDWVAVQSTADGEVNWIIETKGRVFADTEEKDRAMRTWCERVEEATSEPWRYVRINQNDFDDARDVETLAGLLESVESPGMLE